MWGWSKSISLIFDVVVGDVDDDIRRIRIKGEPASQGGLMFSQSVGDQDYEGWHLKKILIGLWKGQGGPEDGRLALILQKDRGSLADRKSG